MPRYIHTACESCGRTTNCCLSNEKKLYCQKCYKLLQRSRCVRCQGAIRHASNKPPKLCHRCDHTRHARPSPRNDVPCHGCGRVTSCDRNSEGQSYCGKCYQNLTNSSCTVCGRGIRHSSQTAPELCYRCKLADPWKGKPCSRCGQIASPHGAYRDGLVFCGRCMHHAQPKRQCHYCGGESRFIHRDAVAGLDHPACPTCRSRSTPKCQVCRRRRQLVGEVDGLKACRPCVERGSTLSGICDRCGKQDLTPNTPQCGGCRSLNSARSARKRALDSLTQEWVKNLFSTYCEAINLEENPGGAYTLIERNLLAFKKIDAHLESLEQLTVVGVLSALYQDGTPRRTFRSVVYWLSASRTMDFEGADANEWWHERAVGQLIGTAGQDWIKNELISFRSSLLSSRERRLSSGVKRGSVPIQFSSILLALKYARWFLTHAHEIGATSCASISQSMLDDYVSHNTRVFHALGSFVRHLNKNKLRFAKLKLPPRRPSRSSVQLVIPVERRVGAVRSWLDPSSPRELRNSCAALLCMFYLQRAATVLSLKRESIRRDGDMIAIDFGQGLEEIDQDISILLGRWLDEWHHGSRYRDIVNSDYVFPGVRPDRGYGVAPFSTWLVKNHGFGIRELHATAIHGLIEAGLTDPGALIYQFGIKPSTALRYWRDSGADLSTFVLSESIRSMRENGAL